MVIPVEEIFGSISFPWWAMTLLMIFVFLPGILGAILYAAYWMVWYRLPSAWRVIIRPEDGFVYQVKSGTVAEAGDDGEGRHRYWLLCYAGWTFDKKTGDIVPGDDQNSGGILGKGLYMIGFFETVAKIRQRWAEVKGGKYILRDVLERGLLVKTAPMAYVVDVMDQDNFPFRLLGHVIWRICNPDKASRFAHETPEIIIGFIRSEWLAWAKSKKIYRPSVDIGEGDQGNLDINVKINPEEGDADQLIKEFLEDLTKSDRKYKYRPFEVEKASPPAAEHWLISWLTSRLPYYQGTFFKYKEGEEKEDTFQNMLKEKYGFLFETMTLDNVILDKEFAKVISKAIVAKLEGAARLIEAYFEKEAKLQSQEPAEKMGEIFDRSPGAAYWELVSALAKNMPASLLDLSAIGTLVNSAVPPGTPDATKESLIKDIVRVRQTIK